MYSSYSYLDESGDGIIVIESNSEWTTTAWTMEVFFDVFYTNYSMFPLTKSGVGVLSNNGKTITIVVPQPPKYLLLTVGSFEKIYSFIEGGVETSSELVYFPNCFVNNLNPTGSAYNTKALVLFNDEPNTLLNNGLYKATLMVGDDIVGYAFGQRFVRLNSSISSVSDYNFGGVIFLKVLFIDKPSVPVVMDFKLMNKGKVENYKVPFDGSQFVGPVSQRFNYSSSVDYRFSIERSLGYFYYRS